MRQASFTVEAALVMPLVLGVIVFLLFAGFSLHDRCVMKSCSQEAAFLLAHERSFRTPETTEEEAVRTFLGEKLWFYRDIAVSAGDGNTVRVSLSAVRGSPGVPTLSMVLPGALWNCETEAAAPVLDASSVIRKTRMVFEWKDILTS